MTCLRPFSVDDLFRFNNVNLDPLTETYGLTFYLQYLARWPEYFTVAENPAGEIMGYIMGKAEGHGGLDRPANAQGEKEEENEEEEEEKEGEWLTGKGKLKFLKPRKHGFDFLP